MSPRLLLPLVAIALAGCGGASSDEPDELLAQVSSPDRTRIARLWCPERCDVPEQMAVTISPASLAVAIEPDGRSGWMPDEDVRLVVWQFARSESARAGNRAALGWQGSAIVELSGTCLGDGRGAPIEGLMSGEVHVRELARPGQCDFLA